MPPLTVAKAEPVEFPKHKTEFVAITAVNEAEGWAIVNVLVSVQLFKSVT